jgi:aspartyl-tRNA(Asn)/glutamyl-tRNA(Gln) amidotransferase subunit C
MTHFARCHAGKRRRMLIPSAMSQTPELNIDYVANLARLALTPEEKAKFSQQLGDVLHHIEQLAKVDVTGIEPTAHAHPIYNVWAEDVARPGLSVEQALRNAPAKKENMISLPKVVE